MTGVGDLSEHRHPRVPFAVALPTPWKITVDPRADVALLGIAPEADAWGFRTNVVVTVDELDRGMTLRSWQGGANNLLPNVLVDYLLLDLEHVHVGDRAGVRRLAHHNAGGRAVTMEQWATTATGRGYTLTVSVSTFAYPSLSDELNAIGLSFRVSSMTDHQVGVPE